MDKNLKLKTSEIPKAWWLISVTAVEPDFVKEGKGLLYVNIHSLNFKKTGKATPTDSLALTSERKRWNPVNACWDIIEKDWNYWEIDDLLTREGRLQWFIKETMECSMESFQAAIEEAELAGACENDLIKIKKLSSWDEFFECEEAAEWSYWYAHDVIKGRWLWGEEVISKSTKYSYQYAKSIIKGPWPMGEEAISKSGEWSYWYARDVIKGPWPMGEEAISKSTKYSCQYTKNIIKGPWPMGEEAISKDAEYSYWCAQNVVKAPWPLKE